MELLKQCVGIDISKDNFDANFSVIGMDQKVISRSSTRFRNAPQGFQKLMTWVKTFKVSGLPLWFVMEATGVYYENLAYFLVDQKRNISVLVPSRAKYYAKSLEIKTKTDKIDAKILAQLGLERKIEQWAVTSPKLRKIKQLSREYRFNKADLNRLGNRLHALRHSYKPNAAIVKRAEQKIRMLDKHCVQIENEIQSIVEKEAVLSHNLENITSIPGISFMTSICIVAETNGFALIRNGKQLASYAGLDVVHNQSGIKEGRSKISKKGNSFIRRALYMPSLCARNHNPVMKTFFERITTGKPVKKIGITAISRKLLLLTYSLWKNDQRFRNPGESLAGVEALSLDKSLLCN